MKSLLLRGTSELFSTKSSLCARWSFRLKPSFNVRKWILRWSCSSRVGFDDYEQERRSWDQRVPAKFNFASDVLDRWAREEQSGQRKPFPPAFWFVHERGEQLQWSFQDLQRESMKTANFLQSWCQIGRNDNVMVILPKVPEFWLVNIAAIRIGCILCPGSVQLTAKDIKYRLSAFEPKCIITDEFLVSTVDSVSESCSSLQAKVVVSEKEYTKNGWLNFRKMQCEESSHHKCADTMSDESMMVFFTSGTSGFPKMVEHAHNYGVFLENSGKYYYDLTQENLIWNVSDTGWAKTAYGSFFAPWSRGAGVFIHQMPRFNPTVTLEVLSTFPIDTFCAPQTAYRMLVQELKQDQKFLKLHHCLSAGEALKPDVMKNWIAATGLNIYEGYGQTETIALLAMFKSLKFIPGSIGKPPPGIEIKILSETLQELGPGEEGEIAFVRKKYQDFGLFKGYRGDPDRTAAQKTEFYHRTGDIGYYDDDGYFWFVGRNDDLINSSGYRIGPYEVESALAEHPAVAEVAVTSSPDSSRGEVVKAFIVLNESYLLKDKIELIKELQDFTKNVTAPYKYPRKIEFLKEIPKTISGKIKRSELKKREWEGSRT